MSDINRSVIGEEDTCCHYFIIKVHDLDLCIVYLEKRRWTTTGSGVSLETWRKQNNPNELELYHYFDSKSELIGISEDTDKWADRDFSMTDAKLAKANIDFILSQHKSTTQADKEKDSE